MAGDKYLFNVGGTPTEKITIQASAGVGDANKIASLDSTGRFDSSLMPTGVAADTAVITASEALSAGDFVNVWNSTGAKVRKADASTSGKEAHGFVLAAVLSAGAATVFFAGTNASITAATPGVLFLSDTVPGGFTATAPVGTGKTAQRIGVATSATSMNFEYQVPIVLA